MRLVLFGLCLIIATASPLVSEECVFEMLTLEQAEQIALCENKNVRTMWQLYEKAKQGRLESISKWMPEVSVVSRGYGTEKRIVGTDTHSAFISQFSLTQAVFSSNRYYNLKISTLEVQHIKYLLDAVIIDVLFEVRTAYYKVILDRQNVETAKYNVELFTSLAERMQSNYEIGTSILLNVNQSKVAIANATAAYYQAIKQLKVDTDRLVTVMGYNAGSVKLDITEEQIPINTIPDIACKVAYVEKIFSEEGIDGPIYQSGFPQNEEKRMQHLFRCDEINWWEQNALYYRPDLRSKYTEVTIADQEVKKEKGTYWPVVGLEANYGGYPTRMLDNPSSSFFNQKLDWAIGFTFDWLLFDSFGREYRVNQARYERNAKKYELGRGVQISYEEVRKQIFSITESVANYVTAAGNVKLAEQTLDLANKQLDIGYITVFDYQIVVNSLIEAIYIRDRARFDLIEGYYGLRHASGIDLVGEVLPCDFLTGSPCSL